MMFKCVECGYEGREFNVGIAGLSNGAFSYFAKCPRCNSRKVKHIYRYFESDLRIIVAEKKSSVIKERAGEYSEN